MRPLNDNNEVGRKNKWESRNSLRASGVVFQLVKQLQIAFGHTVW